MNLLAIDTSTELASVALVANNQALVAEESAVKQHAQVLLPAIERLMSEAKVSFSQLDGIVFGRGPGSFTGLRVACSIAKGLAYAHDLPLYPVSTLYAIAAEQRCHTDKALLVVIDARMNEWYWSYYPTANLAPETIETVSSADKIVINDSGPLILAGTGLEAYQHQLPASIAARIAHRENCFPKAMQMIRLVREGRVQACDVFKAAPVYIRNKV